MTILSPCVAASPFGGSFKRPPFTPQVWGREGRGCPIVIGRGMEDTLAAVGTQQPLGVMAAWLSGGLQGCQGVPHSTGSPQCSAASRQGTVLCDIILLNFLKGAEHYKARKFEEVGVGLRLPWGRRGAGTMLGSPLGERDQAALGDVQGCWRGRTGRVPESCQYPGYGAGINLVPVPHPTGARSWSTRPLHQPHSQCPPGAGGLQP